MDICHVRIENFRALQIVEIPLNKFSILIGENDVGKTSFLYALDTFFSNKKISEKENYFKNDISKPVVITLSFDNLPEIDDFKKIVGKDRRVVVKKSFEFDKSPIVKVVLEDESEVDISKDVLKNWFSSDSFHFIPVRRDLAVQFSMNKTALLGKTLRAKMKTALGEEKANKSIQELTKILTKALDEPKKILQNFLQEQLHNDTVKLGFEELQVDPIEGVSFKVKLSDDRVDDVLIENRGAGTQNNLIIALFRLIADMHIGDYFIFAMEEPENSLHPKAQRQLLSVLYDISRESQVIVTTHSPVFIERSKFENNIILTRTSKGNTVAKTFNSSLLSALRTDLGIRPSDALLKGGGNCAIVVEGNTEEDGFPIFMEMSGMSEFRLGISIINMRGSDKDRIENTARLLYAYDIPCVIVLDADKESIVVDLERISKASLPNIKKVFCLKKGTIEDYYPLEIVADVINQELNPTKKIVVANFDSTKHGRDKISDFKKVMYEHGAGESTGILKRSLGLLGTKMMRDRGVAIDPELVNIFKEVKNIVESQ